MFKYNESSQTCSFIQNLLRSKNVPMLPILRDPEGLFSSKGTTNDSIIPKGFSYIHDGYFYLGQGDIEGKPIPPLRKEKYIFGNKYPNMTNNYIPKESYYSSELHEYLGEYLRAYRDTYRVDLMGLYNCFSNRLISKVSLPMIRRERDSSSEADAGQKTTSLFTTWYKFNEPNNNYKVTCFPIKFNMEYKIKIYGSINGNIIIQPIFYFNGDYLSLSPEGGNPEASKITKPIVFEPQTRIYTNSMTYELNLKDTAGYILRDIQSAGDLTERELTKYLLENEKYLYLFIQVPQSQELQISVIEEAEYFQVVNNTLLNLKVNYNVPFSDRLLEFLTENVITPYDSINQNITRIQTILLSSDFKKKYYKELIDNPLYVPIYSRTTEGNNPYTEAEKQDAVIRGHYKKLKRLINPSIEEKQNNEGEDIQVPPFNIIVASKDEIYSPIPGEYDDTMRVLLYFIFTNMGIPDFTGYVDKDVEDLLLRCVGDNLKVKLKEI